MDEQSLRKFLRGLNIKVVNKSGKWLEFHCPFAEFTHKSGKDSRPSAGAVIDHDMPSNYKCHGCKKQGRISSLIRSLEFYREEEYPGMALEADLADTIINFGEFELSEEEPDTLPPPLNEAAYSTLYPPAWQCAEARAYLKDRGIGKETADYLHLGYDDVQARVVFPVRHTDGHLYGFTGRTILKPEDYPKQKSYPKVRDYLDLPKKHLLLGADLVNDEMNGELPIFVVEGLFGFAHLIEIRADHYCNPVALLGSELTPSKATIIKDWDRLTVLLPDDDPAGDACLLGRIDEKTKRHNGDGAIAALSPHVPLLIPEWPEGKDDPDMLSIQDVRYMLDNTPLYNNGLTKK